MSYSTREITVLALSSSSVPGLKLVRLSGTAGTWVMPARKALCGRNSVVLPLVVSASSDQRRPWPS